MNNNAGCSNFDRKATACDGPGSGMATGHALAIKRMYGPGIILVAAKHNLREIAAEIGADSHIDAARIRDNFNLRGPNTAAGVAQLAKSLLDAAGVVDFRRTAVRALELLFTLPAGSTINPREYFERATCWAEQHFGVPVLSSLVHLDEGAPHCHVLMLPLVNGKMNGSDLHGGKAKLWAMQTAFHEEVSAQYGFTRQAPQKRLSADARASAIARLRKCFQSNGLMSDHAIDVLLKPHAKDPE
ncbi:MAG: plasmid recombination protein [Telluria sp.]